MSVRSSSRVAVTVLLLAVALWIEATPHEPQEEFDYVYLLQSHPIIIEFRPSADAVASDSTVVVDNTGTAGCDGQRITDRKQAVRSPRYAVAATGLPAQPVSVARMHSSVKTVAKPVVTSRTSTVMSNCINLSNVVEYLQGGATTSDASLFLVVPLLLIMALLCALLTCLALGKDVDVQQGHPQNQGFDVAPSASSSQGHNHSDVAIPRREQIPHDHKQPLPIVSREPLASGASPVVPSVPLAWENSPLSLRLGAQRPPVSRSPMDPLGERSASLLTPLCPTLVLPTCDGCFAVPVDALTDVRVKGGLDIVGKSGMPILSLTMQQHMGERAISISSAKPSGPPCVTIGPPASGPREDRALEICGQDSSIYGVLLKKSNGHYNVVKDGQTHIILRDRSGEEKLTVVSPTGQTMASVTCAGEEFRGVLHLQILVNPKVDALLVVSCVLAMVLLC